MFLSEMFDEYKKGYQSLENDKSQQKVEDLRKTRLTLAQINQLRKMNDQRSLEFKENLQKVKLMYGQSAAPAA
jgi:organic radical activating enzyme